MRSADNTEFVLADIPGLIEGAHEGHGLGTRFLGHVERTAVLLHIIDVTQDDVVGAYKTIRAELEAYGGGLANKAEIIALNKCTKPCRTENVRRTSQTITRPLSVIKKFTRFLPFPAEGVRDVLFALSAAIRAYRKEEEERETGYKPEVYAGPNADGQ